ncbi:MAG: hypothetical protein ACK4I8_03640, partial [Armatimonadota bacterium]
PVFVPFSHNALYTPEPSALVLVISGVAVLFGFQEKTGSSEMMAKGENLSCSELLLQFSLPLAFF